jgi:LPS-assembly lipoprotein
MKRRVFLIAAPTLLLAGCGFELRRFDGMPFSSIYIDSVINIGVVAEGGKTAKQSSQIAAKLRNVLAAGGHTRVVDDPAQADVILKISKELRRRTILALSGAGQVSEYRLDFQMTYSVSSKGGQTLVEPNTIELVRDFSYDPSALLAKSSEENMLNLDMEDDAIQQIVRRLRSLKVS